MLVLHFASSGSVMIVSMQKTSLEPFVALVYRALHDLLDPSTSH